MRRIRQLGILVSAIAVVSCHREPTAPVLFYHGLLQSDQDSYVATMIGAGPQAHLGFTLIARYVNRSNAPIYIERCGGADTQPIYGVQPVGDDSVPVGSIDEIPEACGGTAPLVVAAGTVRFDTLTVAAPSPLPANVRLYYEAAACGTEMGLCGSILPDSDRVSNTVQVRATP